MRPLVNLFFIFFFSFLMLDFIFVDSFVFFFRVVYVSSLLCPLLNVVDGSFLRCVLNGSQLKLNVIEWTCSIQTNAPISYIKSIDGLDFPYDPTLFNIYLYNFSIFFSIFLFVFFLEFFQRLRLMTVAFSMSNVKRSIFKLNAAMDDAFAVLKCQQSLIKMEPSNARVKKSFK